MKILLTLYASPLLTFITRVLRDAFAAEEVRQEVFIDAYRSLGKFEGRSTVWSWLCGIAYHRSYDAIRKRRRGDAPDKREPSEVLEQIAAPNAPPIHLEHRALKECMDKISDELRSEVLMRYHDGLSYEEISEIVHKPAGTVLVRVARTLEKIEKCLRRKGISGVNG